MACEALVAWGAGYGVVCKYSHAACSAGRSLGEAAAEAALAEPGLDLAALLALCLSQGALTKG